MGANILAWLEAIKAIFTLMPVLQLVNFEAFRDLVKMLQLGISEETAILLAEDENLDQRASAKSTAVGQLNLQSGQSKGPQPPSLAPAGLSVHLPLACHVMSVSGMLKQDVNFLLCAAWLGVSALRNAVIVPAECCHSQAAASMEQLSSHMAVHKSLAPSLRAAQRARKTMTRTKRNQKGMRRLTQQTLTAWQPTWASIPLARCCAAPSARSNRWPRASSQRRSEPPPASCTDFSHESQHRCFGSRKEQHLLIAIRKILDCLGSGAVMLFWVVEAAAMGFRRRFSRKVAAQRARRMAGQGLGPLVNKAPEIKAPSAASHRDLRPPRRGSPTYDAYRLPSSLSLVAHQLLASMPEGFNWGPARCVLPRLESY